MNDFTKEELIKIKDIMYGITFDDNEEKILRKKIQSLIDNYCEHKKDIFPLYTATGDLPAAGFCYDCSAAVDKDFINE